MRNLVQLDDLDHEAVHPLIWLLAKTTATAIDTPLHLAATTAHRDVAELLLASGVDVNAGDRPVSFRTDGHRVNSVSFVSGAISGTVRQMQ
jgi:hypothetical protein